MSRSGIGGLAACDCEDLTPRLGQAFVASGAGDYADVRRRSGRLNPDPRHFVKSARLTSGRRIRRQHDVSYRLAVTEVVPIARRETRVQARGGFIGGTPAADEPPGETGFRTAYLPPRWPPLPPWLPVLP